ncbi:MAG: hypothetical protein ACI37N_02380 [Prevotella sp.]
MSEEEAVWISNEYLDSPFFAAVKSFVRDVSGINGMPAGHPSLVFYLAVFAIDHIKCINNRKRRLEKCRILKNEIIYHLKLNQYSDENKLAAVIIYCVQYGLEALSFSRCIKEIFIMSEHINELVTDQTTKDKIREISRKCFWVEDFQKWFVGYYEGKEFISETIIAKLREMRKANPPKDEIVKKKGKGNRNKELFSDENMKRQMVEELKKLFSERGLKMTEIKVTKNSKELNCIVEFYGYMIENKIIEDDVYPRSYIRFLKEGGFSFAVSDKTVEGKLRIKLRKT